MTKRELDQLQCSDPNCTQQHAELALLQECHRDAGALVLYDGIGNLVIRCKECDRFVATVAVAEGPVQ